MQMHWHNNKFLQFQSLFYLINEKNNNNKTLLFIVQNRERNTINDRGCKFNRVFSVFSLLFQLWRQFSPIWKYFCFTRVVIITEKVFKLRSIFLVVLSTRKKFYVRIFLDGDKGNKYENHNAHEQE